RDDASSIRVLAGIEDGDDELVIRREVLANGRGRALVNGAVVTTSALKTLGDALADLHGHHQHRSRLRAEGQRDARDGYGAGLELTERTARLSALIRSLEGERHELAGRERERALQEETLRGRIAEIEEVAPVAGEDDRLSREESLLRNASEVAGLAGR